MRKTFVLAILLSILLLTAISGYSDIGTAPVIKVNISFIEKENVAEAENYTLTPGSVSYFERPRTVQAKSFPAIAARATFLEGKNSIIGPWETLPYNGNGTYSFNIGFDRKRYPKVNDTVHVSIMVADKNGDRIGYVIEDIIWTGK